MCTCVSSYEDYKKIYGMFIITLRLLPLRQGLLLDTILPVSDMLVKQWAPFVSVGPHPMLELKANEVRHSFLHRFLRFKFRSSCLCLQSALILSPISPAPSILSQGFSSINFSKCNHSFFSSSLQTKICFEMQVNDLSE